MTRSSFGLVLRRGNVAGCVGRLEIKPRYLSSIEKPNLPTASSLDLMPVGDGRNLPAKLIDFQSASKIDGEESHIATVQLRPRETLRAEAGAMLFMTEGIEMDTNLSGASSGFTRLMTGMWWLCVLKSLT